MSAPERQLNLSSVDAERTLRQSLATYGNGVTLRTSTLPLGGTGVFAERGFERDAFVTEYEGLVVSKEDVVARAGPSTHVRSLWPGRWAVDALQMLDARGNVFPVTTPATQLLGRGVAGYCNDPRGSDLSAETANAAFVLVNRAYRASFQQPSEFGEFGRAHEDRFSRFVVIAARRRIAAGEEIFVDYGEDFWRQQRAPPPPSEEERERKRRRRRITPTPVTCCVCRSAEAALALKSNPDYRVCESAACRKAFEADAD